MRRPRFLLLTVFLNCVFTASCATSLYKVKPVNALPPFPANAQTVDAGGLTVHVAPPLTDEQTQELFEVNLPLAGILAVRTQLDLKSGEPLELKRARFVVRDSQNREWKLLSTKQTVSRIMKANGMSVYNPNAKKQFESDLGAYGLDVKTPLSSAQPNRQGFLFFQTPDKRAVDNTQKLTLVVDKLPQPISVGLN